jgi:hypothetical protein
MSITPANLATTATVNPTRTLPAPMSAESSPASNSTDLARLRELLHNTVAGSVNVGAPASAELGPVVADGAARSLGDSILEGILSFRGNYQNSVDTINTRVLKLAGNETAGLNSFSEIMSLQLDVSKWSMSVMGVDNASKSGTNTIKELSRG